MMGYNTGLNDRGYTRTRKTRARTLNKTKPDKPEEQMYEYECGSDGEEDAHNHAGDDDDDANHCHDHDDEHGTDDHEDGDRDHDTTNRIDEDEE